MMMHLEVYREGDVTVIKSPVFGDDIRLTGEHADRIWERSEKLRQGTSEARQAIANGDLEKATALIGQLERDFTPMATIVRSLRWEVLEASVDDDELVE